MVWREDGLLVEDLLHKTQHVANVAMLDVLDAFGVPRRPEEAAEMLSGYERRAVREVVRRLKRAGLLVSEASASRQAARVAAWNGNLASANYHLVTRDISYVTNARALDVFMQRRSAAVPRPPAYKSGPGGARIRLTAFRDGAPARALDEVLRARRTVRRFARRSVTLQDLAAVVVGTWGQTGWFDGGPAGRFLVKTSPSAGALHPIECYVLAWRVRGLAPGLYHFDVQENALRRLRSRNPRREAVRAASSQTWVGGAAFVCIMTAVFERTLWKYHFENAYRLVWMDAGHLAQTFALLATARGLGPFQTAAIQDSYIEKLIGIDGMKEFPIYLCGAGVPRVPSGRAPARSS